MNDITTEQAEAMLSEWYQMQQDLKKLKAEEMNFRKAIFNTLFPEPVEGTNKYQLKDGFVLNASYSLGRKVDEAAYLESVDNFEAIGIRTDDIVRKKIELAKPVYNKLTDVQRAQFDQVLIIKPDSPSLAIVKPKGK